MEMNRVNDEQTWRLVQENTGLLRLLLEEVDRQRSDLVRSLTTSDVHDPGFFQELDTFSTQLSEYIHTSRPWDAALPVVPDGLQWKIPAFTGSDSFLHPQRMIDLWKASSLMMRGRADGVGQDFWENALLTSWASSRESSTILIRGRFRALAQLGYVAFRVVDYLQENEQPVAWILNSFPPIDLEKPTALLSKYLLRQLAIQTLQIRSSQLSVDFLAQIVEKFRKAITNLDWVNIIALVLKGMPHLYLVADLGVLGGAVDEQVFWMTKFKQLCCQLNGNFETTLKVILFSAHALRDLPEPFECVWLPVQGPTNKRNPARRQHPSLHASEKCTLPLLPGETTAKETIETSAVESLSKQANSNSSPTLADDAADTMWQLGTLGFAVIRRIKQLHSIGSDQTCFDRLSSQLHLIIEVCQKIERDHENHIALAFLASVPLSSSNKAAVDAMLGCLDITKCLITLFEKLPPKDDLNAKSQILQALTNLQAEIKRGEYEGKLAAHTTTLFAYLNERANESVAEPVAPSEQQSQPSLPFRPMSHVNEREDTGDETGRVAETACTLPRTLEVIGGVAASSAGGTKDWFDELKSFKKCVKSSRIVDEDSQRVKVAVLDTGVCGSHPDMIKALQDERLGFYDFVENSKTYKDLDGHGTHCASLVLTHAKNAKVFVGRVFESSKADSGSPGILAKAIEHAWKRWKVDIISISLGFTQSDDDVEDIIKKAAADKVLIFAASANNTNNEAMPIRFPARMNEVIAIFSSNAFGFPSRFNPEPNPIRPNFKFPGEQIKGAWPCSIPHKDVFEKNGAKYLLQDGTSCATPIAAAVAAEILEFVWQEREPDIPRKGKLKHYSGMSNLFLKSMTDEPSLAYKQCRLVKPWMLISQSRGKVETAYNIKYLTDNMN